MYAQDMCVGVDIVSGTRVMLSLEGSCESELLLFVVFMMQFLDAHHTANQCV